MGSRSCTEKVAEGCKQKTLAGRCHWFERSSHYKVTSKPWRFGRNSEENLKCRLAARISSGPGSTDFSSTKPPALNTSTLPRLDKDPHVFLGLQQKGTSTKQGEKPLLIPDFVNQGTYDNCKEEQETGNNSNGAKIVICSARGKPKLEHVTLSMWVARNSQIMHELLWTGKLSATTTAITASNPIHSPRLWHMITSIVNYSVNMAFCGGATCSTFIPDFWLNTVLCRPQLQPHPTHRDFPHALTANHKPHPQLQFATNNLIR